MVYNNFNKANKWTNNFIKIF